jgi:hypothetical protein
MRWFVAGRSDRYRYRYRVSASGQRFAIPKLRGGALRGAVPVNLTAADVEKLFGAGVCADARLRRCDLIPEAQARVLVSQSSRVQPRGPRPAPATVVSISRSRCLLPGPARKHRRPRPTSVARKNGQHPTRSPGPARVIGHQGSIAPITKGLSVAQSWCYGGAGGYRSDDRSHSVAEPAMVIDGPDVGIERLGG